MEPRSDFQTGDESKTPLHGGEADQSKHRRLIVFGAIGVLLALGAPAGWFVLRLVVGPATGWEAEIVSNIGLYSYLLISTVIVLGLFGAVMGSLADQNAQLIGELRMLALTDSLTGLRNARDYHMRLAEEVARVNRNGGALSVISFDLDLFKRINDSYGHDVGDVTLTRIGACVRAATREGDVACRVGGEEFAIICVATDEHDGFELAQRVRRQVELVELPPPAQGERVTASFGVAALHPSESAEQLTRSADRALYEAKHKGRNCVEVAGQWDGATAYSPRGACIPPVEDP